MSVQRLAASARPLAEVLVDRLREASRRSPFDRLRHYRDDEYDDHGDTGAQAELPLGEDEEQADRYDPPLQPLRPDEAAATVLLGRGLDENRELLSRLQERTTIAIIEVPSPDLVELIDRMLRDLVFGDVSVINGDRCKPGDEVMASGSVILFSRGDDIDKKALAGGNAAFGAAVQRQAAIIGIAADPDRVLPSDLVRLADQRIMLPPFDAEVVTAVIEAITGRKPPPIDENLGQRRYARCTRCRRTRRPRRRGLAQKAAPPRWLRPEEKCSADACRPARPRRRPSLGRSACFRSPRLSGGPSFLERCRSRRHRLRRTRGRQDDVRQSACGNGKCSLHRDQLWRMAGTSRGPSWSCDAENP